MSFIKKSFLVHAVAIAAVLFSSQCSDNRANFDELEKNRLYVILKGTYESNNPKPWAVPADMFGLIQDDSVDSFSASSQLASGESDEFPKIFMIDIAEMRLVDSSASDHKFSNYRQTLAFSLNNDNDILFNGTGYLMENDDVEGNVYIGLMVYLRKIVMDKAKKYDTGPDGWIFNETLRTIFAEQTLYGFPVLPGYNFIQHLIYSHYDRIRLESLSLNRVFPMVIPITAPYVKFDTSQEAVVLEVRFVVKNYIKKYEVDGTDVSGAINTTHFYSFSDWLYDVRAGENDLGGNIFATARMYIPGMTGAITGTNNTGNDSYVIAIPSGDDISEYTLPDRNNKKIDGQPGTITAFPQADEIFSYYELQAPAGSTTSVTPGDNIEISGGTFTDGYYIVDSVDDTTDIITIKAHKDLGDGNVTFTVYPITRRNVNPCDFMAKPAVIGSGIEATLDYYARYERYRYDYNFREKGCHNMDQYAEQWNRYTAELSTGLGGKIRIPPFATFVEAGGAYTLTNVNAPGSYDVYTANVPDYGFLFHDGDFTLRSTVDVPVGGSVTVNFP